MSTSTPPPAGPTPPPPAAGPPPPGPTGTDSFFDAIRRTGLVRSDERWVGGVAGGLARRLGIDPLVVRGLLAVSVLLGGIGLILYGIGWALLPEQRDGRIHLQQLFRGDFDAAIIGAIVVFVVGLSFPDRWNPGMWWGADGGAWGALLWLSAVAVIVVLVVASTRDRRGPSSGLPPTGLPPAGPPPPTPAHGATPGSPDQTPTQGPVMTQPASTPRQSSTGAYPAGSYSGPPASSGPTTALPPHGSGPHGTSQHGSGQYGSGHYSSGQYGSGQYGATPPPRGPAVPPPPAALPRPRPSGPGATTTSVVVALTLLTLAVLMYLERDGVFSGPVLPTAGAVGIVLAGAAIVVSGLRGRTSGTLGFLAVVGILVVGPTLAVIQHDWVWYGSSTGVGDLRHTPRTVAEAEEGYSIGAGDARIDLTELPTSDEPVEVPISVGAGTLTVVVPEDGDYEADVRVFAGEVTWLGDSITRAGGERTLSYTSESVADGAEADLVLDITVGAGTVDVREE